MDITNNDRWGALHDFAKDGSYTLFTYFASLRTDVNIKTNNGKNCLYICGLYGRMPLCKTDKDSFNFNLHIANNNGWSAMNFSARSGSYKLVKYSPGKWTNIDLKTNDRNNCRHIAVFYGHLKLWKTFIGKCSFDVCITDKQGWNALYCSTRNGRDGLFSDFARIEIGICTEDKDGWKCHCIAIMHEHLNLRKILINKHNFDLYMVYNEARKAVKLFLKKGSQELLAFLLIWEMILNWKQMIERTVFISQHSMDISNFTSHWKINIIFMYLFQIMIDVQHLMFQLEGYILNYLTILLKWEVIFTLKQIMEKLSSYCNMQWTFKSLQDTYL